MISTQSASHHGVVLVAVGNSGAIQHLDIPSIVGGLDRRLWQVRYIHSR